ncbi:hypothetical protein BJ742DRAFT_767775 [Cladochytrium replicatum]|nr:hypothetical protein BJ742DRAFT_767775 [Cladochytrium replicatum]
MLIEAHFVSQDSRLRRVKVLILGLLNTGKTTLLLRTCPASPSYLHPIAFSSVYDIVIHVVLFEVLDYFNMAERLHVTSTKDAVIYVIDGSWKGRTPRK